MNRSGWASIRRAWCSRCSSLACGPMNTPFPPDSEVGLITSSRRRPSTCRRSALVGQQIGGDVLEDRLLAQVEADHLGDVVVDRLVVGDARADRVGDRHRAGAVGADEPGNPEQRVGAELERVDEVVVEPAVDRVHPLQTARSCACSRRRRARRDRSPRPARFPSGARGRRARNRPSSSAPASTARPSRRRRRRRAPPRAARPGAATGSDRRPGSGGPRTARASAASSPAGSRSRTRYPTASARCPRARASGRRRPAPDRTRRRGSRRRQADARHGPVGRTGAGSPPATRARSRPGRSRVRGRRRPRTCSGPGSAGPARA